VEILKAKVRLGNRLVEYRRKLNQARCYKERLVYALRPTRLPGGVSGSLATENSLRQCQASLPQTPTLRLQAEHWSVGVARRGRA
jgi:hypothetical protein